MNNQYLQFVREQLIIATADLSGATKGQLEAWQENAMFDTGRYRRKKIRYRDEVTGKMITRDNPPIPGKQSLAKGTSIPLVSPIEFSTSSWRRAVLSLEEHHKAWLLWCYSGSICWEHDTREAEDVLDVAVAIAEADGEIEPEERKVLEEIAGVLGLRLENYL